MTVEIAADATPELLEAIGRLLPQLSSAAPPDAIGLASMIEHEAVDFFFARGDGGRVVGLLTLITFPIPTGVRSWVEDVVVDEAARGNGVATALVEAACQRAAEKGARSVDLTSRPTREAANRLYQHLGFVRRETNVYRRSLRD